jgi:hypothetical protein
VLSVAAKVKVNVHVAVGVPVMERGGTRDRVRSGGREPEVMVALKGPTSPERAKFCRYDWASVPGLQQLAGKEIVSGGAVLAEML